VPKRKHLGLGVDMELYARVGTVSPEKDVEILVLHHQPHIQSAQADRVGCEPHDRVILALLGRLFPANLTFLVLTSHRVV
jgi:hypothetical protein